MTENTHLSHPKYRADIDGLRAIAILSVVVFHAFPDWMKGGFIGVDIFFVISGFLISTIIFENLDKGTFSFAEFYARRIKRIFPALLIVMIACLSIAWFILLADELNQLGKHIVAGASFVSNLVLWSEAGYFDNSAESKPLLHLWSLGVEEQFYIIWPFLVWLAWKRNINLLILSIIVVTLSFSLNINNVYQDPVGTFFSPLTRFWELLFGSILAWYSLKSKSSSLVVNRKKASNYLSALGIFIIMYGFLTIDKNSSFPGFYALIPVLGSVLIIMAGSDAWFNRMVLSNKFFVWLGLISFPLYLWHWPILSFGYIVYGDVPHRDFRILAVFLSIFLAWLTFKFIEQPLRFGNFRSSINVTVLSILMFAIGITGFFVSKADFSKTHTFENIIVERKDEHAIGSSLAWYHGKNDWLFLGNAHDKTVEKLKLSITPSVEQIDSVVDKFSKISEAALEEGVQVVLIMGPNKSSIYPEYLPDKINPSTVKYSSFFIDKLKDLPNITLYDPTRDLLSLKGTEGILYWKTDTHWNSKGAFLTYAGFSKLLALPIPKIEFKQGQPRSGDLIAISKLKDFPLSSDDNWDVIWKETPAWKEEDIPNEQKTAFGSATIATNNNALSDKHVWVVGDSFSGSLKPYFNATFKEVRYVGHWHHKLDVLPEEISKAERKPDLIVIIRVERSF